MRASQQKKERKRKVSKGQSYNGRRQADRVERSRRRARTERRRREQRQCKVRGKGVRYYRKLREQVSEKRAIELTLARWSPTELWHFPLWASSIRQWHRTAAREGFSAGRPKAKGPPTIH